MVDQDVRDELAIRNLVARYADAVTRGDPAAWAETWSPDGEWHVLGRVAEGREAACKRLAELLSAVDFAVQIAGSGVVELAGERATGQWTITEHTRLIQGGPLFTIGRYDDEYERNAGKWRFAVRRFEPLYMGPPDLSALASRDS